MRRIISAAAALTVCFSLCTSYHVSENVFLKEETAVVQAAEDQGGFTELSVLSQTLYNSENGLSIGKANAIAQTDDGIIWIATYAGLYSYNGYQFTLFDSLSTVRNVNCMLVDDDDNLWLGTNDGGFSVMKDGRVVASMTVDDGVPSNSVRCIAADKAGNYYIGTPNGMVVVSYDRNRLRIKETLSDVVYTNSSSAGPDNLIAAVSSKGEMYLLKDGSCSAVFSDEDYQITGCSFYEDGTLSAGTSDGRIVKFDVSGEQFEITGTEKINDAGEICSIIENYKGNRIVSASNGIFYSGQDKLWRFLNSQDFTMVETAMADYQDNIWFTSSRKGILKLADSAFVNVFSEYNVDECVVNSVAGRGRFLYAGTDSGLIIIDTQNKRQVKNDLTEMFEGVRIRSVKTDSRDHLMISSYGPGLADVDARNNVTLYNSDTGLNSSKFRTSLELSDGRVAVCGDAGVSLISADGGVSSFAKDDGLTNEVILCMTENNNGDLLAGSNGDGIFVIRDGSVVRNISRSDGLASGVVMRIAEDRRGDGFFLVTSTDLYYMDREYRVSVIESFPFYNNFDVIQDDDGDVFVLSSIGIFAVPYESLMNDEKCSYQLLDSSSGLKGSITANSWNYTDGNGNLYFSADSGVFRINLEEYDTITVKYKAELDKIYINNLAVEITDGGRFVIPKSGSKIEFKPEIYNYTISNPYISGMLDGYDTEENPVPLNEYKGNMYINLPSGKYSYHLRIYEEPGGRIIFEESYPVEKEKKLFENKWFIAGVAGFWLLIIVLLAVVFTRMKTRKLKEKQKVELRKAKEKLDLSNQTIVAIARMVDARDETTSMHSQRVSEYSVLIGKKLGFSEHECEHLRMAALLHDIGKVGIPDSILNKPGKLTDEEFAVMKSHVSVGGTVLKDFTMIDHVAEGAMYHHERYDGKGYVSGLKGSDIPLFARIIGIADAFDAMTANRVYRKRLSFDTVLEEIGKGRGTQFDPEITDIFLSLIEDGSIDESKIYGEEQVKD